VRVGFIEERSRRVLALARHDEPWERAVAVCGLGGVGCVAFRATNLLTGSRMQGFKKRAEALGWLVAQAF